MNQDDDETVLRAVFNKYDTKKTGYLSLQQFILLITRLGKHVRELRGVEFAEARSAFALFDKDSDGKLNYAEFANWWTSENRYSYFSGEKAILLRKAYALYTKYTNGEAMTISKFSEMMEALGITYSEADFDALDKNEDGLISFDEFCQWLEWF